ncbi:MAG: hypothetical protein GWN47_03205 [Woeseiaceae bacterium]|nr:hypothetical protein [Woeseiaceae bacterium]
MTQIAMYLLAAVIGGAAGGWLLRGISGKRQTIQLLDKWQLKYDEAARQRDRFNAENTKLRTSIEAQQSVLHKHEMAVAKYRTELQSVAEKAKSLNKELFSAKTERDEYQRISNDRQGALAQAKYQVSAIEEEFKKTGVFYKGELQKSLDKRRDLQSRVEDAMAERESLTNLLEASQRETESINKMLSAAQTRLGNLDSMEQKVITLEAENAQLRHDSAVTHQTIEALQRDVAELDELKIQNKELSSCLRSMETSRKQYERDAKRYRDKADQSDKRSETLRMKLDDVEKSFANMARKHDDALKVVRRQETEHKTNGEKKDSQEVDDLTQIVGIGKVFEKTLHELGICSFRQIANFGPADIARVNMELKEFKGRMEQDDWVGQARELYFQKYGGEVS